MNNQLQPPQPPPLPSNWENLLSNLQTLEGIINTLALILLLVVVIQSKKHNKTKISNGKYKAFMAYAIILFILLLLHLANYLLYSVTFMQAFISLFILIAFIYMALNFTNSYNMHYRLVKRQKNPKK